MTELRTYSQAEIDAMPRGGGSTGTPHVVVVGVRSSITGDWLYAIADPVPYREAQASVDWMHRHGEVDQDHVAFTRPAPEVDLNAPPCETDS
jgi:hypothetical protein